MQATVTIPASAPQPPAGHDAAMVARFDAGQAAAAAGLSTVPPAPPAGSPAAAPAGAPAGAPAASAPAATPSPSPAPAPLPTADAVDSIVVAAGLDRNALQAEINAGALSDASYAALAAKGYPKSVVDGYIEGQRALNESRMAKYEEAVITSTVGTREKFTEVVTWAASSLTPAEIDAFNAQVNSGDQAAAALAVAGLQARFKAANPAEPALIAGGAPAAAAVGYESWAQVKEDMKKPEYTKDPAFRDKVRQRLAVSGDLK